MEGTKPYKFTGFGAMEVTKPYKFIGFGAMEVTKPYKFIGFGSLWGPPLGSCLPPDRPRYCCMFVWPWCPRLPNSHVAKHGLMPCIAPLTPFVVFQKVNHRCKARGKVRTAIFT